MEWAHPLYFLLLLVAIPLLWWFHRLTLRSLTPGRARLLLGVRIALVVLAVAALAKPAWQRTSESRSVIFIVDHSHSMGRAGLESSLAAVRKMAAEVPKGTAIGLISAAKEPVLIVEPAVDAAIPTFDKLSQSLQERLTKEQGQTNLASAVSYAFGLFPAGAKRIVIVGDGQETHGQLAHAARRAGASGVVLESGPLPGPARPDARVVRLVSNKSRSHEGATFELTAELESTIKGPATVKLYENGIEVEQRKVEFDGTLKPQVLKFERAPEVRNDYNYLVKIEDVKDDSIAENNAETALVQVTGEPRLLYIAGEPSEAHYLKAAVEREGITLEQRTPQEFPRTLNELAGYDAIVLSDVPAHQLTEKGMAMIREYVDREGGGLVMIGGKQSFGVGGYYRTPIEEILPVKMKAPDKEEKYATALALVIDRSGSMQGQKIEICKSAAVATVDLLSRKDYITVVTFDSSSRVWVPIRRVTSKTAINSTISSINASGGTNAYPGMSDGYKQLQRVTAKVKHMIVLSDGQTRGTGYRELAAQMKAKGITTSAVAVGAGAQIAQMKTIADAGGGKFYQTLDPSNIPKIFTQDAMTHMGRLIREVEFQPTGEEPHPMLRGLPAESLPKLDGYVKTTRRSHAQSPLAAVGGDPLLAHWQYGLGKVTAFTSDAKSRWAYRWLSWPGYNQFWAQIMRETARQRQSRNMDIQLRPRDEEVEIVVDLRADASTFLNEAEVTADVYYEAPGALGAGWKRVKENIPLRQTGPGRYAAVFVPQEPGNYSVKAFHGATQVTAGLSHSLSGETASGKANTPLLTRVAHVTGGRLVSPGDSLELASQQHTYPEELWPYLVGLLLGLFLVDVGIRRWENVQSMATFFRRD